MRKLRVSTKLFFRRHGEYKAVFAFLAIVGLCGQWKLATDRHLTSFHHGAPARAPLSGRAPASETCADPAASPVTGLAEKNRALEARFPRVHAHKGRWLHWDLAQLPFAQARFLTLHGEDSFKPFAEALSPCRDVACLYNTLTADLTGETGELVWNWYLKTGMVPVWGETFFTAPELRALYFFAQSLPEDLLHRFELVQLAKQAYLPGAYQVRHRKLSLRQDSVSPANFSRAFVRAHSARLFPTAPSAALAEQAARYLWDGFALKAELPEVYARLNEQVFHREWTLRGEMEHAFRRAEWDWREHKRRHLRDCLDLHHASLSVAPRRGIASLQTVHPVAACLRASAPASFLAQEEARLRAHPRACQLQQPFEGASTLTDQYLGRWQQLIQRDIDQVEWQARARGTAWLREQTAREALLARVDPTWAYFECDASVDPRGCYRQQLGALLRAENRGPASVTDEILEDYPHESIRDRLRDDLGARRSWMESRLSEVTQKHWMRCWHAGPNELVAPDDLFPHADGKFGACLSNRIPEVLEDLAPGDGAEARHWRSDLKASLRRQWSERISKETAEEARWLEGQLSTVSQRLLADLRQSLRGRMVLNPTKTCLTRLTHHYPPRLFFHDRAGLNFRWGQGLCTRTLRDPLLQAKVRVEQERQRVTLYHELVETLRPDYEKRVRGRCHGRIPSSVEACHDEQFSHAWHRAKGLVSSRNDFAPDLLEPFRPAVRQDLLLSP
jgi:hypothetical protein